MISRMYFPQWCGGGPKAKLGSWHEILLCALGIPSESAGDASIFVLPTPCVAAMGPSARNIPLSFGVTTGWNTDSTPMRPVSRSRRGAKDGQA